MASLTPESRSTERDPLHLGQSVFLIGFMGAGKTAVGKALSRKLHMPFFDQDALIAASTGKTPSDIFAEQGENSFRSIEASVLKYHISRAEEPFILATGGGCPCFFDNMELMIKAGITVYLKVSPALLLSRLSSESVKRPLLAGQAPRHLRRFIEDTLLIREPFYQKASILIDIDKAQTKEIVVLRIIQTLGLRP